jgi:hypothetical protein
MVNIFRRKVVKGIGFSSVTPKVFGTIQGLSNNDGLQFPSFQAPAFDTTYSNNL